MNYRLDIRDQVAGNWASVLHAIGIDAKTLNGRHHDCLMCGKLKHGRWDIKKNFYICTCGAYSAIDVAMQYLGYGFSDTANHIRKIIGATKMEPVKQKDDSAQVKFRIDRIYKGLKRITADTPAGLYLMGRCIRIIPGSGIAFHPGVDYWEQADDGVKKKKGYYPALVGIIRDKDGELKGLQIQYLTDDGKKLDVSDDRKNIGEKKGNCIRLGKIDKQTLCIAEGVVTALSVIQDTGFACWAAIDAQNMEEMHIPDGVKHVYIYADQDKNGTGYIHAYALKKRLSAPKYGLLTLCVVQFVNGKPYYDYGTQKMDYNDYLLLINNAA